MTPRRLIYALAATMFAVAILLFGLLAEMQRRDAFTEADRYAQSLAETLAGHAERLLDASNLIANVAILYAANRSWEEMAASETDQQFFQRFIDKYEYIEALWLTDANGTPRLTSRGFPAPNVDTSDRAHFIALRDGGRELYISGLIESRVTPGANIVFARRPQRCGGRVSRHRPGGAASGLLLCLLREDPAALQGSDLLVPRRSVDAGALSPRSRQQDRRDAQVDGTEPVGRQSGIRSGGRDFGLRRHCAGGSLSASARLPGPGQRRRRCRRHSSTLAGCGGQAVDLRARGAGGVVLSGMRLALQRLQREEAAVAALRG